MISSLKMIVHTSCFLGIKHFPDLKNIYGLLFSYRMRENFDQLWEMIGKKGGHVYICGDAKMMAKDVRNIIVEVVQKGKQLISCKTDKYNYYKFLKK